MSKSYMILHHMKAYYPTIDRISFNFSHLDPRHLGTDQEILKSLRCIREDFGQHNPLYYGHEEAVNAMLVHFYRLLVQSESFFYDDLLAVKEVPFKPYPAYLVYFERRTDDDTIMIGDELCYRYDSRKEQWLKYDHYKRSDAILGFNNMFNNTIYEYYHMDYGCYYSWDDGKYKNIKEKICQCLDQLQLTIEDPQYKNDQQIQASETIRKIRKVNESNTYDRFIKQGRMLEKIRLVRRPPLIIHDYAMNYDELTDNELLAYLYCRTNWQLRRSVAGPQGHRLLSLYATEVINGLGADDEKQALDILEEISRKAKALNHVDVDYALVHHLDADRLKSMRIADGLIRLLHSTKDESLYFKYLIDYFLNESKDLRLVINNQKDPAFYRKLIHEILLALKNDTSVHLKETELVHKQVSYQLFNGLIHDPQIDQKDVFEIRPIRKIEKSEKGFYYDYWSLNNAYYYRSIICNIIFHAMKLTGVEIRFKERKIDSQINGAIVRILITKIPVLQNNQEKKSDDGSAISFDEFEHVREDADEILEKLMAKEKMRKKDNDVPIDFNALDQIREDAYVTSEKLMTEEEMKDEDETEEVPEKTEDSFGLTAEERDVLRLLMKNQRADDYVKKHHLMISVVADAINEKLFDEIGDNIIEFDGDQCTLVEDYRADVEELLRKGGIRFDH